MADQGASGKAIANAWFGLLAAASGKGDVVKPYLDPAFQIQRNSGERFLASNYIPTAVHKFTLSNIVVTAPTPGIRVVRYGASTPGAKTSDKSPARSGAVAPRLSVFRWDQNLGHWVVVSHANFNTPLAAECDHTAAKETAEKPPTSAQDVATGEQLVNEWRDVSTGKLKKAVLDPKDQIQLASGACWPNPGAAVSQIKWSPAKNYQPQDIVITRNGDLLVATYSAVVAGLKIEGKTEAETSSPRLITYRLNNQNQWKLIALANFDPPKDLPKGVDCSHEHGG